MKALAKIAIVTPVLDDWPAFGHLLREVGRSLAGKVQDLDIVAVDDGSAQSFAIDALELPPGPIRRIEITAHAFFRSARRAGRKGLGVAVAFLWQNRS